MEESTEPGRWLAGDALSTLQASRKGGGRRQLAAREPAGSVGTALREAGAWHSWAIKHLAFSLLMCNYFMGFFVTVRGGVSKGVRTQEPLCGPGSRCLHGGCLTPSPQKPAALHSVPGRSQQMNWQPTNKVKQEENKGGGPRDSSVGAGTEALVHGTGTKPHPTLESSFPSRVSAPLLGRWGVGVGISPGPWTSSSSLVIPAQGRRGEGPPLADRELPPATGSTCWGVTPHGSSAVSPESESGPVSPRQAGACEAHCSDGRPHLQRSLRAPGGVWPGCTQLYEARCRGLWVSLFLASLAREIPPPCSPPKPLNPLLPQALNLCPQ